MSDNQAVAQEISRPDAAIGDIPREGVVMFPFRRKGEMGVYEERISEMARSIEDQDIPLSWSEPEGKRGWQALRSADVNQYLLEIVLGVAGNAAWQAIVMAISKSKNKRMKLSIGTIEEEGRKEVWLLLEGDSETLSKALKEINPWKRGREER